MVAASRLLETRCKLDAAGTHNFLTLFKFKRPTGFDGTYQSAKLYEGHLFLGFNEALGFAIRGQVVDFSSRGLKGLCFVGVPWLWWIQANAENQELTLSDFPVHDVQMDQLLFMTTQQAMVDDLQALNDELGEAKSKLEEVNLHKQRYFDHVSHEMRTPLNGILSALTLLQSENHDERTRELLLLAEHSSKRLLEVLNFTLDSAAMESGAVDVQPEVFDLDALLEECLSIARPRAMESSLELVRSGQRHFDVDYFGKAGLLRQVLANLLSNAIKFSDDGVVALSARLRKSLSSGDDVMQIRVADEGPGVPKELHERLFEPFATGLTAATQGRQGTGLGLSIVKRFVEAMGGTIAVESELDIGTTFTIEVPLKRAERLERKPVKAAPSAPRLKGSVLLVDDMQTNLLLNAKILESLGLEVTIAQSGREAVDQALANHQSLDLVFMDLEMPGMDGFEATKLIRAQLSDVDLPIIAFSGRVTSDDRRKALAAGMNNFIAKPLVKDEVVAELEDWLAVTPVDDATPEVVSSVELAAEGAVFDQTKVAGLVSDVGAVVMQQLVCKFLSESAQRWDALRDAIDDEDMRGVVRESHTLGSTCLSFGLLQSGSLFRRIESAALNDQLPNAGDLETVEQSLSDGLTSLDQFVRALAHES